MSNNAPSFLVVIKTPYPRYRCQARGNQHLPLVAPNASMARWGQQRSTPASLTLMLDLTRTADLHGPIVGHPWLRSRFTLVSPSLAMLRVPRYLSAGRCSRTSPAVIDAPNARTKWRSRM